MDALRGPGRHAATRPATSGAPGRSSSAAAARPRPSRSSIDQELAAAGAPEFVNVVGLDVLGPSLLRFGTDEQRRRYIPPILVGRGDLVPGLLRARRRVRPRLAAHPRGGATTTTSWSAGRRPGSRGDSSPAGAACWRARTRPAPKHRGISMLIVDMRSPGVELRPMTQITGHAEFCELFLDDVVVPRANLLGELGDGWKIAMHTLGHERGTAALPRQVKLRTWLDRAVRVAAERTVDGAPLIDDPGRAGRAGPGAGRRRGAAPPRVPHRRRVPQRRRRRARQLERQAADGRGRAAARGDRARGAGHHARARRARGGRRGRVLERDVPVLARRDASTAARSRSSATSSPTASSRFPRSELEWTSS